MTNQLTTYDKYFNRENLSLESLQEQYNRFIKEKPQAPHNNTHAGNACGCGYNPQPKPTCGCNGKKEDTAFERLQKIHLVLSFIAVIFTLAALLRK